MISALQIAGLSKHFDRFPVLRDLDLEIRTGGLTALLGASGSGKTTLLRLICGFERMETGTIHIAGTLVAGAGVHLAPERRRIGYVAQEGALFPHLNVAENIAFGLPRAQRRARQRVEELLALVGLPASYGARPPQALSGGEQQRVALARAMAPAPALILLDEPFSALDAGLRVSTRQAVLDVLRATGATGLIVTHDQSEALSMGDQVAVLRDGYFAQVAAPRMLYSRPVDPDLAHFLGEAQWMPGVAAGGRVECLLGTLATLPDTPKGDVRVLLRPEQISLCPAGKGLPAQILHTRFLGPEAMLFLKLIDGPELMARVPGHLLPETDFVSVQAAGPVMVYPQL